MKRIYILLSTVLLSISIFSCEKKNYSEEHENKIERAGDSIKHKAEDVGETMEEESKKTTKNGDDAH